MKKEVNEHYLKKELYELIKTDNSLFDFIQEGSLDGIWYWNLENIVDEWLSPKFWEVLGYDPKEKKHSSSEWQDIIFIDDLVEATKNFEKHLQDPKYPYDQIVRYKHKNGSTVWIRCRGIAIRDKNGKAIRMLGAHTDITDIKQKEATLIESEQRFEILHNASFGGIAVHDKGIILECNQGLSDITGFSLEELMGMNGLLLIAPDYRDFVMDKILTGYEKPYEVFGIRKNGEIYPLKLEARNLPYQGKQVRVVEFRDVTELKRKEIQLIKSEQKFRTLFEKAPFGYQSLDESGRFIEVNEKWLEIMGYHKEEVIGKWFGDFLVPEMKEQFKNRFEMFKKRGNVHSEFSMLTKDGNVILAGFDGNVSYDENHSFIQTHCTVTDITEINIASQKLKQSEEKYRLLTTHMPLGLNLREMIYDNVGNPVDYRFLTVNDSYELMTGLKKEEIIGKTAREVLPNIENYWIDKYAKVISTGESVQFEDYSQALGRHYRVTAYPLPKGIFAVITEDITERVHIEEQRAKEHLDLLISQKIAKLGNWRINLKTNEVTWSEELYKMYGFDPTQPIPLFTEHVKFFTKQSWDQLSTAIALTSTQGTPFDLELEMILQDGSKGWVWIKGAAEYDEHGKIVSLTGAAQDITKQKQAEEEIIKSYSIIKEQQRTQETLISNLPGISYHSKNDDAYTMIYISDQVAKITGYTSQDFYDNKITYAQLIHPEDSDRVHKAFNEMSITEDTVNIDYRIVDKDGSTKWVRERAKHILNNSGKDSGFIEGFIEDITEIKLLTDKVVQDNQIITSILGQSPVAIEFFDSNGYHTYSNDAALKLFGVQNSIELKGLNLFDNPNIPIELCDKIKKAETIHVELEYDFTKVQDKNFYQTEKDGKILLDLSITPLTTNQVISGYIIHSKDITEEKQKQNEIEYLSNHDYLTNLYNRRYFVNAFNTLASKDCFPHGLMMIDINGLKIINDAYGHVKGDEAIKRVSNLLMEVFDKDDVIARIGGDEFVVLVPDKNALYMQALKDKLVLLSQDIKIDNIPVSLAIGYEILSDNDKDFDELLSKAEKQLYRHKITVGESIRNHAIKAILSTLTDKYKEEKIHSEHVSQLCKQIGTELGLSKEDVDILEIAGMYHDIGKISIPDAILDKPGKLTDEEYEIIKTHTQVGYQILRAADEYSGLAEYALSHHERWDGRGYPRGLKGEAIPLFSRIINVADSFEAMTADRPYRKGMKVEDAVAEIKRCSGSQFDPEIANLFLEKVLKHKT